MVYRFVLPSNLVSHRIQFALGSITQAVAKARSVGGFSLLIEVEVQSEAEANEAIEAGADIIMLDNFGPSQLADAAAKLRERWAGSKKFLLESSGGIDESNITSRAINGADFSPCRSVGRSPCYLGIDILSTSAVHQSVQHVDFSLKIQKPKQQ